MDPSLQLPARMQRFPFILFCILCFPAIFGPTAASAEALDRIEPWLGGDEIDVKTYQIQVVVPHLVEDEKISVKESIELETRKAITSVKLHYEPSFIQIKRVSQKGRWLTYSTLEGPQAPNSSLSGSVLNIFLTNEAASGTKLVLELEYQVVIHHSEKMLGFTFDHDFNGNGPTLSTRNWPYYARYWLPSHDHPSDPASFKFEIHVPTDYVAAANGALESGSYQLGSGFDANGLRIFKWTQSREIPTYDINIAIGRFQIQEKTICYSTARVSDELLPCSEQTTKQPAVFFHSNSSGKFSPSLESGAKALAFASSALAPFGFSKLGFVSAPSPFDMESASLISLVSPKAGIHEVMHHWWGNGVLIKTWGDLWISEGFTTYFTGLYDEIAIGKNTACMENGNPSAREDVDPLAIFTSAPYCAGAAALADLRKTLAHVAGIKPDSAQGRDLFLRVAADVYRRYSQKPLGTRELVGDLKQNVSKILQSAGYKRSENDVQQALSEWERTWFGGSPQ